MGNRAVITAEDKKIGVYLHWNGGYDSVRGFLTYCKMRGFRPPEQDCYGWSYFVSVVANFFGDGLSVGVSLYENLDTDNGDNGVYIIKDWEIVKRENFSGEEQNHYTLLEMLLSIDKAQPSKQQVGESKIKKYLDTLNG